MSVAIASNRLMQICVYSKSSPVKQFLNQVLINSRVEKDLSAVVVDTGRAKRILIKKSDWGKCSTLQNC